LEISLNVSYLHHEVVCRSMIYFEVSIKDAGIPYEFHNYYILQNFIFEHNEV
jgi:hypothetical protein